MLAWKNCGKTALRVETDKGLHCGGLVLSLLTISMHSFGAPRCVPGFHRARGNPYQHLSASDPGLGVPVVPACRCSRVSHDSQLPWHSLPYPDQDCFVP